MTLWLWLSGCETPPFPAVALPPPPVTPEPYAPCGVAPTEVPPLPAELATLHLTVDRLVPGASARLRVDGAAPGAIVGFWQGGVGGTTCPPTLGGCLDMAGAALLAEATAGPDGVASVRWQVPSAEGGYPMFQAALPATTVHSQVVMRGIVAGGPPLTSGFDEPPDGLSGIEAPSLPPGDYFELAHSVYASFPVRGGAQVVAQVVVPRDLQVYDYVVATDPLTPYPYGYYPNGYPFDVRDTSAIVVSVEPYGRGRARWYSIHVAVSAPPAPRVFSADRDLDGFGCEQVLDWLAPDGYVDRGGDCDEADPDIHPTAIDVCEDGIDQDCTGADRSCHAALGGILPIAEVAYAHAGDLYPSQVAVVGDRDGDYRPDVLVSGPESASLWTSRVRGEAPVPTSELSGLCCFSRMDAAGPGDVDGDGRDDLLIADYDASDGHGAVYLVTRTLLGAHAIGDVARSTIRGAAGSWLQAVGAMGDADGDGVPDVVVASHNANAAYLFYDLPVGTTPVRDADAKVTGPGLGADVLGADLDGDGLSDLIASSDPGVVWVVAGPLSGVLRAGVDGVAITGGYPSSSDEITVGDVDGDGHLDLAARVDFDGGGVGVASGPLLAGGSLTDVLIVDASLGGIAGDLDGDGRAELAVVDQTPLGRGVQGLTAVFAGGLAPGAYELRDADAVWTGGASRAVAGIGDVDGDGRMDLAVANTDGLWLIHGAPF